MRWAILPLLLAVFALAFKVVDYCGDSSYASLAYQYAVEAYNAYSALFGRPLPLYGDVVLKSLPSQYAGLTYIGCGASGCYAYRVEISCGLSNLREVIYHEFAHVAQAMFISPSTQYDWYTEASAEGLAAYVLREPTRLYQGYYYSEMWKVSPKELGEYSVKWYYYSAPMAWLIWRYGVEQFVQWTRGNYSSYLLFLLSPWDWGRFLWAREPEFETCGPWSGRIELKPYTAQYCRDFYYDSGTAVVSGVPVNATVSGQYLLLAFAAPAYVSGSYTITPIPPVTKTVTATVTQTATVTTTVTETTTRTETVTVVNATTVTVVYTTTAVKNYTVPITVTTTATEVVRGVDWVSVAAMSSVAVALILLALYIGRKRC